MVVIVAEESVGGRQLACWQLALVVVFNEVCFLMMYFYFLQCIPAEGHSQRGAAPEVTAVRAGALPLLDFVTPNEDELRHMYETLQRMARYAPFYWFAFRGCI